MRIVASSSAPSADDTSRPEQGPIAMVQMLRSRHRRCVLIHQECGRQVQTHAGDRKRSDLLFNGDRHNQSHLVLEVLLTHLSPDRRQSTTCSLLTSTRTPDTTAVSPSPKA
uniref:Transposase n=1 Tax=Mesocestoides corti TaxID=53468 RepID=A0A5K3EQD9_MESCO